MRKYLELEDTALLVYHLGRIGILYINGVKDVVGHC